MRFEPRIPVSMAAEIAVQIAAGGPVTKIGRIALRVLAAKKWRRTK